MTDAERIAEIDALARLIDACTAAAIERCDNDARRAIGLHRHTADKAASRAQYRLDQVPGWKDEQP